MITDAVILSTADLAAAATRAPTPRHEAAPVLLVPASDPADTALAVEPLAPLFRPNESQDFRAAWDTVQIGIVDVPKQAVRKADELVAQVMKTLAESFASERSKLEDPVDPGADHASTENLRVALRRYRSFFQRLLSL
jgi:hypothetical protein